MRFSETTVQVLKYQERKKKTSNKVNYEDSIKYCIENSYIDDYRFTTISGKILETDSINKPLFILTSASWCVPCMKEIEPLNKLAERYAERVQFIVLFWDTKEKLKNIAEKYNTKIAVIPSPKANDYYSMDIDGFKHVTGYPCLYLIKNKKIINYSIGSGYPPTAISITATGNRKVVSKELSEQEKMDISYKYLKDKIDMLLE